MVNKRDKKATASKPMVHRTIRERLRAGEDFDAIGGSIHSIPADLLPCFGKGTIRSEPNCKRSEDVFEDIEPACRLASALVMSEEALKFWQGLKAASERYAKARSQGKAEPARYFFEARSKITSEEIKEMQELVRDVARRVIVNEDMDTNNTAAACLNWIPGDHELCNPDKWIWFDRQGQVTEDTHMLLRINGHVIDDAGAWQYSSHRHLTISDVRVAQFRLAAALVHEFGREYSLR